MSFDSMRSIINNIFTLEHCVVRFITAWCFVCFLLMVKKSSKAPLVNNIKMVQSFDVGTTVFCTLLIFVLLMVLMELIGFIKLEAQSVVEKILLMSSTLAYTLVCVFEHGKTYYLLGMSILMILSVIYCFKNVDLSLVKLNKVILIVAISLATLLFMGFVGTYMAMRALNYDAPNFDMGLFSQMYHYMKTTFTMKTTCERDHLMSHMCVHIAPDFYLLLPFYSIFSSAAALEVMQVIVVASAVIPLTLLCLHKKLSYVETFLMVVVYLLYPVTAAGCGYDLHENMFFPVFLLLFLYFMEKDNNIGMLISMLLVWFVKEDAAVFMMFTGIYMILEKKKAKGLVVLIMSVLYFIMVNRILSVIGTGAITDRFNNVIYNQDGNLLGVIKTAIVSPAYMVTQCMKEDRIEYMVLTIVPLLGIQFCTKNWNRLVLIGPYILFNIMADYQYFHDISFQYSFGPCALFVYMAVCNLSEMNSKTRSRIIPAMTATALIFFSGIIAVKANVIANYNSKENREIRSAINEGLHMIPKDSSVIATTFLITGLSDRDVVYELYYTDKTAEYYALDLRGVPTDFKLKEYQNNSNYEQVYYKDGIIAIFRDASY